MGESISAAGIEAGQQMRRPLVSCCGCGTTFVPTGKGRRCHPCRRLYDAGWRAKRIAEGLPVRGVASKEYQIKFQREYLARPEVLLRKAALMRQYSRDPVLAIRKKARREVRRALQTGQLARQACEVCGAERVEAHHDDYSRPLSVRWLCRPHHRAVHARAEGRA